MPESWQRIGEARPLKARVSLATEDFGQAKNVIKTTKPNRGRPKNLSPMAPTKWEMGILSNATSTEIFRRKSKNTSPTTRAKIPDLQVALVQILGLKVATGKPWQNWGIVAQF